jgi:hypothetical protein
VPNAAGEGAARDTVAVDCAELGGTCGLVDGVGAWCIVPVGTPCASGAVDRVSQYACGTTFVDPTLACDLEDGCRAVSHPCPPDGESACGDGSLIMSCAQFGQALVVRCEGTCDGARCIDQPAEALCDDDRLHCADGLACLGSPAGRCVDASEEAATDAGPERRAPFEESRCTCVAGGGRRPVASGLVVLAVAVVLRSRRR